MKRNLTNRLIFLSGKILIYFSFNFIFCFLSSAQSSFLNGSTGVPLQECNYIPNFSVQNTCSSPGPIYSPNGQVFTPKGDLKALIIFAGFGQYDNNNSFSTWPVSSNTSVPSYLDPVTGSAPSLIFSNTSDFSTYAIPSNTTNKSISRFYYEMSKGTFRLMGDVFKDPATGIPVKININPSGAGSWGDCNKKVIQQIQTLYPTFNWAPYDSRKNWPNFQCDNSTSAPDNKPDYVIIIYRYSTSWVPQPTSNMLNFIGGSGGYSVLDGLSGINFNGYTFDGAGFTFCSPGEDPKPLFYHELAHELISMPHILGNNSTTGFHLYGMNGWSVMTGGGFKLNQCASSWERWISGWSELVTGPSAVNSDILNSASLTSNGEYILRDFATSGDAIRLKLPNTTDQYVWIENHQALSIFDHQPWAGQVASAGGEIIPDIDPGIYMYNEEMLDSRSNISTTFAYNENVVNGIRPINAQGNFDYSHSTVAPNRNWSDYWNNVLFTFNRGAENPISGINPWVSMLDDYPKPEQIAGSNDGMILRTHNYNGGQIENYSIIRESNGSSTNMLYANTGGRNSQSITNFNRRSDAFQVGDVLDLSSNPTIVSYPKFIDPPTDHLTPTLLSGISIRILSKDPNGDIHLKIGFNETDINRDVRWCGEISLTKIGTTYDVNVKTGKTLTLDKNGIPNRTRTAPFINPSVLDCQSSTVINLEPNSSMIVDNGSTLRLESNSILNVNSGAVLRIKRGSVLEMQPQSRINIENGGQVIIEGDQIADALLDYHPNAEIYIDGSTSVLDIQGKLKLEDNSNFTFGHNSIAHGYVRFGYTTNFPSDNIIAGANCSMTFIGTNRNRKVLLIDQETMYAPSALISFKVSTGTISLGSGSRWQANGLSTIISFSNSRITSSVVGINNQHRGITLFGQPNVTIDNSTFEYGRYGINALLTYGGAPLTITNSIFRQNTFGIYTTDKGLNLVGCHMYNNTYGWFANAMSFPSKMFSGQVGGSTNYANITGINYNGHASAPLYIEDPFINSNETGINVSGVPASVHCGSVSYNTFAGFKINKRAALLMDGNVAAKGAQVTAVNNGLTIKLLQANYIYLNKGFNDISPLAPQTQTVIAGVISSNGPIPIITNNNRWNNSANFSTSDYNVVDMNGTNILISDNAPLSSGITCGQAIPPCTGPLCDISKDALSYCPECPIVNSEDFNEPLNDASREILALMQSDSINNFSRSVELYYQILMNNFSTTGNERFILNFDYFKMIEALASAIEYEQIDIREGDLPRAVNEVLEVQNKFIEIATSGNDYFDKFHFNIEKAQTYRLANRRQLALNVLAQMTSWTQDDDMEMLQNFECIINKENAVLNGSVSLSSIPDVMEECRLENSSNRLSHSIQNSKSDTLNSDMKIPSFDNNIKIVQTKADVVINSEIQNGEFSLINSIGEVVYSNHFSYETVVNTSAFRTGLYIVIITDLKSNLKTHMRLLLD